MPPRPHLDLAETGCGERASRRTPTWACPVPGVTVGLAASNVDGGVAAGIITGQEKGPTVEMSRTPGHQDARIPTRRLRLYTFGMISILLIASVWVDTRNQPQAQRFGGRAEQSDCWGRRDG